MLYFISLLAIALPWLNPFAPGPTPAVPGWVFSWSCAAIFLLGLRATVKHQGAGVATAVVANAWLIAAVLSALMGLVQFFGLLGTSWSPWVNSAPVGQAFANLRQRNQFATLTSIGLLAVLWHVAQWSAQRTAASVGRRWGVLAAAVVLALGNAASSSRTGLLQWLAVLLLTWVWSVSGQRRGLWVAGGAVLVYGCAVFALPAALDWLNNAQGGLLARLREDAGCGSRRVLWANVLHLIAQKPWLGLGWGELDYAHFMTLYPGERFCDLLDNAHNLPLHLAVELGVPVALLLCALTLWWIARVRPWQTRDPNRQLAWGVLLVIFVHSLLEYPLWYGPFQVAAVWCVWTLGRTTTMSGASELGQSPARLPPIWRAGGVATTVLAVMAWVAVDYWRMGQLYLPPTDRATAYRDGTLAKLRALHFFQDQVRFAELTTTPLERSNAQALNALAKQVLHFSPEPRVVEKLIESAVLLQRDEEALFYLERYRAAYPEAHARWAKSVPLKHGIEGGGIQNPVSP